MTLPLLLSVPHAGLRVPPEVQAICTLSEADIIKDGDEFAREIYAPLETEVAAFLTTDIARAVVDLNRAEDDFHKDGVIKRHTCWDVPVYRDYPPRGAHRDLAGPLPSTLPRQTQGTRRHRPDPCRGLSHHGGGGSARGAGCRGAAPGGMPVGRRRQYPRRMV